MRPDRMGSLSSMRRTGRAQCAWRLTRRPRSSPPAPPNSRTSGKVKAPGSPTRNMLAVWAAPAGAPTTTISCSPAWAAGRSRDPEGPRTGAPRAVPMSAQPPKEPGLVVEDLVAVLVPAAPQRLVGADPQDAEAAQALVQELVNAAPQVHAEMNHDVPADDDVELVERPIGREVVLPEHDVLSQRGGERHGVGPDARGVGERA